MVPQIFGLILFPASCSSHKEVQAVVISLFMITYLPWYLFQLLSYLGLLGTTIIVPQLLNAFVSLSNGEISTNPQLVSLLSNFLDVIGHSSTAGEDSSFHIGNP